MAVMACVIVCVTVSCHKEKAVSNQKTPVNLLAPSGARIAASLDDLRKNAAATITRKHGSALDITITSVQYLQAEKGYAAIVNYRLPDGTLGNFAVVRGVSYQLTASQAVRTADEEVHIVCAAVSECSCFITGVRIDAEGGTIVFNCTCGACVPLIIIS